MEKVDAFNQTSFEMFTAVCRVACPYCKMRFDEDDMAKHLENCNMALETTRKLNKELIPKEERKRKKEGEKEAEKGEKRD